MIGIRNIVVFKGQVVSISIGQSKLRQKILNSSRRENKIQRRTQQEVCETERLYNEIYKIFDKSLAYHFFLWQVGAARIMTLLLLSKTSF